jgi:glycosyltransferase involved in cell wall biosynthesis
MSTIHVLQLIDGLNIGGAETLLLELSSGLVRRGFRLSIGYSTHGPFAGVLKSRGFNITRLPRLMKVDPFLWAAIIRLVLRDPPHIVHTHLFKSDFHGRLAARLAGVPVIVSTLHSNDQWAKKWPLGALYGWTAHYADRVIAVSDDVRRFHLKYTGISEEKLETIENGINVERYSGQESAGRALRREFGLDDSAPVFGIVGRLSPPKDHLTFLQSAALILKKAPHARFLVVGDGPLRQRLESLAGELGLTSAVIFTGFRKDIPAILSCLDVLVFTSLWEGLPVTLLEGMAAGLPVVATSVGGIPSVVLPGKTAFLVPPADPTAFADACLALASDSNLRRSFGRAGLEHVTFHYSLDRMLDKVTALYVKLLQQRGLGHLIPSQALG